MAIMAAARKNDGNFNFTLHLTEEPGAGYGIDELQKSYVGIRVNGQHSEVPFIELLVIVSIIEAEVEAWRAAAGKSLAPTVKMRLEFPTQFSDDEVERILGQLVLETPSGRRVRLNY